MNATRSSGRPWPRLPGLFVLVLAMGMAAAQSGCCHRKESQNVVVGNMAHQVAAAHFLGKRPLKNLVKEDSFLGPVLHPFVKIETGEETVSYRDPEGPRRPIVVGPIHAVACGGRSYPALTAKMLGVKRTAVHRGDLGCTLLPPGQDASCLKPSAFRIPPAPAPRPLERKDLPPAVRPALDAAVNWAFDKYKTRAVVILHGGKIIAERYCDDPSIGEKTLLTGWSMSKTVTNALLGILVRQGKLDIHAPTGLPEWQGDGRREITVDQLMRMVSGLKFSEPESQWWKILHWDLTRMLYLHGDMSAYVLSRPLKHAPGTHWQYKSGASLVLSRVMRRAIGGTEEDYLAFPYRELFHPIGMSTARFEVDCRNNFVCSSYVYAPAREWARFGQLYLQKGVWEGRRILPEGWVDESVVVTRIDGKPERYGAHVWSNEGGAAWDELDRDVFMAQGVEGQNVAVVPHAGLVIVRLGWDKIGWIDQDFAAKVIEATRPLWAAVAASD